VSAEKLKSIAVAEIIGRYLSAQGSEPKIPLIAYVDWGLGLCFVLLNQRLLKTEHY